MDTLVSTISEAGVGLLTTQKVFLLFNKVSGAYIAWVAWHHPHGIDENLYDIDVVESFSSSTQKVIGFYPNHQVVEIADQPQEISEVYIDGMTVEEIKSRYSLERQVNNIAAAVLALAEHVGATQLESLIELADQVDSIKEILEVGNLRKEGYSSDDSFVYVSKAAAAELEAAKFEGGLGEIIGPRQISAVRN